jgi:hypothetical protein
MSNRNVTQGAHETTASVLVSPFLTSTDQLSSLFVSLLALARFRQSIDPVPPWLRASGRGRVIPLLPQLEERYENARSRISVSRE